VLRALVGVFALGLAATASGEVRGFVLVTTEGMGR